MKAKNSASLLDIHTSLAAGEETDATETASGKMLAMWMGKFDFFCPRTSHSFFATIFPKILEESTFEKYLRKGVEALEVPEFPVYVETACVETCIYFQTNDRRNRIAVCYFFRPVKTKII